VEILRCRFTRAGESIMPAACMHVLAAALSLSLSFSLTTLAGGLASGTRFLPPRP
jgi:hypothetical protein